MPSTPGFEQDIRPLFRPKDIEAMMGQFDLSSYDDVRANATAIQAAVSEGDMPCDETWPPERVSAFGAWIDAGFPE